MVHRCIKCEEVLSVYDSHYDTMTREFKCQPAPIKYDDNGNESV